MATFFAKHIGISIEAPAEKVYQFAVNPENLPAWASGLSGSIEKIGDEWIADSPMGRVRVKFESENRFGILDHEVTLPNEVKVYNPLRVFPNNNGCEVVFSLFRLPNVTDDEFARDAGLIENDLKKLKELMEK